MGDAVRYDYLSQHLFKKLIKFRTLPLMGYGHTTMKKLIWACAVPTSTFNQSIKLAYLHYYKGKIMSYYYQTF